MIHRDLTSLALAKRLPRRNSFILNCTRGAQDHYLLALEKDCFISALWVWATGPENRDLLTLLTHALRFWIADMVLNIIACESPARDSFTFRLQAWF